MPKFVVKYTVIEEFIAIVESSDLESAKLVNTEDGEELGNKIISNHSENKTTEATKIDEINLKDV